MKTTLAVLGVAAALAACGKPAEKAAAPAPAATAAPSAMDGMAMTDAAAAPGVTVTANGTGVVTAVDPVAGTITIDHQPIPAAGWPQMTMAFKVSPAVVGDTKAGDKVTFDLTVQSGAGEVTAIRPQN